MTIAKVTRQYKVSGRFVPADHFTTGVFAPRGTELLSRYTCVCCGHHSTTWASFRAHRANCWGELGPDIAVDAFGEPIMPLKEAA